jgi:chromosome condensin MukBEF MukE localization factor
MFDLNFYNDVLSVYRSYFADAKVVHVHRWQQVGMLSDFNDSCDVFSREYIHEYVKTHMVYFDVKPRSNETRFTRCNNILVKM